MGCKAKGGEMNDDYDSSRDVQCCPNPNCNNQGWYPEMQFQGYDEHGYPIYEPAQVQCEFCYTEPLSVFNVINGGKL